MKATILTLYPDMFPGPLEHSLPGKALAKELWSLETIDIRDFATNKHRQVDDTPYGGGAGMVMKADIVGAAIEHALNLHPDATLIHFTPRGTPLTQKMVKGLMTGAQASQTDFLLLCGRFEGIDQRVIDHYQPLEISLGDFVLFGGEVATIAFLEAALRYLPGLLGNDKTHTEESFDFGEESALLLEYPHYTAPPSWNGRVVPEVLRSGHHENINAWRRTQAEAITQTCRPDLWQAYQAARKQPTQNEE